MFYVFGKVIYTLHFIMLYLNIQYYNKYIISLLSYKLFKKIRRVTIKKNFFVIKVKVYYILLIFLIL